MDPILVRMDQINAVAGKAITEKLTQAEFSLRGAAEATGIPYVTLRRKLAGKGRTGFELTELYAIAELLDCAISDLLPPRILRTVERAA